MHFCGLDFLCKARKTRTDKQPKKPDDDIGDVVSRIRDATIYSYDEMKIATNDFHPNYRIGVGGFGTVYKGILRNGVEVAVKKLSAQSKQGVREFLNEIQTISDAKHDNLVQLYGCCIEAGHRILVYEYLENNSVAQALLGTSGSANCKIDLDWNIRAGICLGTACGLFYLHEKLVPPVVHRDIKASNVLLDKDYNPKISDFGLARLFPENITHISTRVAGTVGYLAPEYAIHGQLTKKADIYSFGILVLEIISGRGNSDSSLIFEELDLLEWTWKLKDQGKLLDIVDPTMKDYRAEEIIRFIKVALLCTQAAPNFRPSISQVVEMLSKDININESLLVRHSVSLNYKQFKEGFKTHRSLESKMTGIAKGSLYSLSSMTTGTTSSSAVFTNIEGR